MQTVADVSVDQILLFLFCFVRIASMLVLFPIFGSRNGPLILKGAFSLILAAIIFPTLDTVVLSIPTGVFSFAVIVIKEVIIGITIGFVASLIFAAVQFGGNLIDHQMGFLMAQVNDPLEDAPITPIAQFNTIFFMIIFLAMNGHHFFITAIRESFNYIQITQAKMDSGRVVLRMVHLTGGIFVTALKIAAPVMVTHFIVTVALGIIARTLPQMNIFIVGLPLNIGISILLLVITFGTMYQIFEVVVDQTKKDILIFMQFFG